MKIKRADPFNYAPELWKKIFSARWSKERTIQMNYSRNIKKVLIGKRVLISWVAVAIIFSLVGLWIGAISTKSESCPLPETTAPKEILIFGKPDGKIFEGEMLVEWACGDLKFVPLDVPMDEDLQEFTFYLSAAYEMDFTFVMALIQKESGYTPDVISRTDDYGLMQINKINHPYLEEQLGISDFLDPYDNIRAGMFILRKLFEKYQTPEKVLMAYNMGENGASRLWEQGIFEINYSKSVLEIQCEMRTQLMEAMEKRTADGPEIKRRKDGM